MYTNIFGVFLDKEAVTELDAKLKEERKQAGEMVSGNLLQLTINFES